VFPDLNSPFISSNFSYLSIKTGLCMWEALVLKSGVDMSALMGHPPSFSIDRSPEFCLFEVIFLRSERKGCFGGTATAGKGKEMNCFMGEVFKGTKALKKKGKSGPTRAKRGAW